MLRDGVFDDFFGRINLSMGGKYLKQGDCLLINNVAINAGVVNKLVSRLLQRLILA
jgi:hypothetical protein